MERGFFLISLTEHNLLLASLFIFPHRLHMHTPLLIWACTPTPPLFSFPLPLSLSLSLSLSLHPSLRLIEKSDTVN